MLVSDMIAERLPVSLFYGGMTFFISYFISIPLGYYKALKHGSVFDSASSILIFVGYALPGYVVGVLLITLFSYHLEWFPMGGFVSLQFYDLSAWGKFVDLLSHSVLPLICYLIGSFAIVLNFNRPIQLLQSFRSQGDLLSRTGLVNIIPCQ